MSYFHPQQVVYKGKTKKGKDIVIRYPRWEDIDQLTEYINKLSAEDTFVLFSGEKIKKEEECRVLASWFVEMELKDAIWLVVEFKKKIIGVANISRNKNNRKRSLHVGHLGISVKKEFRGERIGEVLLKAIIEEAKDKLPNLRMIFLEVYEKNYSAWELYQKLGFKKCGQIPGYLLYKNQYIDAINMVLFLNPKF